MFHVQLALVAVIAATADSACTSFPCTTADPIVASCDETGKTDYFPNKLTVDHSLLFDVTYHGYYKVVSTWADRSANVTARYLLVQRGCTEPNTVADITLTVPVPVINVEIESSTFEAYIEILGERAQIVAKFGLYTASPCTNAQIVAGLTNDSSKTCPANVEFSFNDAWPSRVPNPCANVTTVIVYAGRETQLLPQLEWVEFFAVFFNKEAFVDTYVRATEQRIECISAKVQTHVAARRLQGLAKPKVLWISGLPLTPAPEYQLTTDPAIPWSLGSCPNYYCDALQAAGANILNLRSTGHYTSKNLFSAGVAGDADVIFAPTANNASNSTCSAFWSNTAVLPGSVPARADQRVYDFGAVAEPSGGVDWFNSQKAEPAVLIETIAHILYPELGLRGPLGNAWWQNVFTEASCTPETLPTRGGLASTCTADVAAVPFLPALNTECPAPPDSSTSGTPTPPDSSTSGTTLTPPPPDSPTSGNDSDSDDTALIISIVAALAALVGVSIVFVFSQRKAAIEDSIVLTGPNAGGDQNSAYDDRNSAYENAAYENAADENDAVKQQSVL